MRLIQFFTTYGFFFATAGLLAQQRARPDELRLVLANVQFAAEKTSLRPGASRDLDEVAALMQASPSATIEIGAHTDASGSASYNLRLSQKRAQAVSAYLLKKGVAAKRLSANGYGETRPLNRCRRGVRCSEAEKMQNRRIEIRVSGLPADSTIRAPWLALGGLTPRKPLAEPTVPKMTPTVPTRARRLPEANNSVPLPVPERPQGVAQGDYFPELSSATTPAAAPTTGTTATANAPKPLPQTFTGYTVEVLCSGKPLPAGDPLLRTNDPVYLRSEAGGLYCYYIGAFFTLPEARQFLLEKALPAFPKAQVVAFANDVKTYFTN